MLGLMDTMNPAGNPNTAGSAAREPFGPRTGRPLRTYKGGPDRTTEQAAPTKAQECVTADLAPRVEFLVRAPAGINGYNLHYGRWVMGPTPHGAGDELNAWLELGVVSVAVAAAGQLDRIVFETATDAVGVYVDNFDGSVTPGGSFDFWYRGLPGTP